MAKRLQLRRGTTAQHATFTGVVGEVTVDTTKKALVVHDGTTLGGITVPTFANTATETAVGLSEIATQAEVNAATDDTRFVTPLKLLNGVKNHLNATGNAPIHAVRTFCRINVSTGTPVIQSGSNISSVSDVGAGAFRFNFITALSANYTVLVGLGLSVNGEGQCFSSIYNESTTGFYVNTWDRSATRQDPNHLSIGVLF